MGKCDIRPQTENFPNPLKWQKLFYQKKPVGDILASFDLILINKIDQSIKETSESQISIPKEILPKTMLYTIEILFWGLRNVRNVSRFSLMQEKLFVVIEIGDMIFNSTFIEKNFGNDNFIMNRARHEIVSFQINF